MLHNNSQWETVINEYNQEIIDSAKRRLDRMTDADIFRFQKLHDLNTIDRDLVLQKLIETGKFRSSTAGIHTSKREMYEVNIISQLPDNLNNKNTCYPARSFGKPWIELFQDDNHEDIQCFVTVYGLGRREKDNSDKIWLFEINEGLWECFDASPDGLELIRLDQKWALSNNQQRVFLWEQVKNVLAGDISFSLRFGNWHTSFYLQLKRIEDINVNAVLQELSTPTSSGVFNMHRYVTNFPFSWEISH